MARDARWWVDDVPTDKRHERLLRVVRRIQSGQSYRKDAYLRNVRMYNNQPVLGLGISNYARPAATLTGRLAFNVIKSCCDAFTAKLTKDRPKVTFVTSGGDWAQQRQAKQLDKFVEGIFYGSGLYDTAPAVVMDAGITGTGFVKVYAEHAKKKSRIVVERVFPWEIVVDDQEAMYGAPRTLYQRKYVDRLVLCEMFKDDAKVVALIQKAVRDPEDVDGIGYDSTADQVLVTEGWHLPSGPDAEDGRHCIVIENATLHDERYSDHYFPFVPYRRQKAPIGYWGIGLAEELTGIQVEMNVLLQKIQRSHHLLAAGHWLVENGSKVNSQQLDNDVGSILRYTGTPPQLVVGQVVSPEVYQHLERLYQKAYEITGISQLSAQSQKPVGLNSGKALRTYANIESERFNVAGREYHAFYLEAARQIIDRARDIAATFDGFEVKSHSKNAMQRIKFKDVDLQDEEFVLKMYPTNLLATEPEAKMDQVADMMNTGMIDDPSDARRLLDFPDIDAWSSLKNADHDLAMDLISKIMDAETPEYIGPEPLMNLEKSKALFQLSYLNGVKDGAPEDRLRMLLDWIQAADDMVHPEPPPGPPAGAPMPPGPPDPGAPPPGPPGPPGPPPPPMPPVPPAAMGNA